MMDLATQINVGLAQILGLVAILSAVLMWRMATMESLLLQMRLLRDYRRTGYAPSWVPTTHGQRLFELASGGFGLLGGVLVFAKTFHYLVLTGRLADGYSQMDLSVLERLRIHAEGTKEEALILGFTTLALLATNWLLPLLFGTRSLTPADLPARTHPFLIPAEWTTSPTGLWESRIRRTIALLSTAPVEDPTGSAEEQNRLLEAYASGSWRGQWSEWARCVSVFQGLPVAPDGQRTEVVIPVRTGRHEGEG